MDATARALAGLRSLARTVRDDLPATDEALPALRALLDAVGLSFKLIGGLAVVHHGYARFTADIEVLVDVDGPARLADHARAHGFVEIRPRRLVHQATGVRVDLVVARELIRPRMRASFPAPESLAASPRDPAYVALAPPLELKLRAGRAQDIADVTQLLKRLDDAEYLALEAATPAELRGRVATPREDALEELRFEE